MLIIITTTYDMPKILMTSCFVLFLFTEDIIGMVITIKHFKPSNGKRQVVTSRQPLERELSDYEGLRIEDVSMTRECYSLSQFLKRLRTSGSIYLTMNKNVQINSTHL